MGRQSAEAGRSRHEPVPGAPPTSVNSVSGSSLPLRQVNQTSAQAHPVRTHRVEDIDVRASRELGIDSQSHHPPRAPTHHQPPVIENRAERPALSIMDPAALLGSQDPPVGQKREVGRLNETGTDRPLRLTPSGSDARSAPADGRSSGSPLRMWQFNHSVHDPAPPIATTTTRTAKAASNRITDSAYAPPPSPQYAGWLLQLPPEALHLVC